MEQYIKKSALVAEIERRKEINKYRDTNDSLFEDEAILSFLNSLEVKEVDLEKSARHYLLQKHLSPLNNILHQADLKTEMQYHKDIESAFKAGYEFCLKVQKGE